MNQDLPPGAAEPTLLRAIILGAPAALFVVIPALIAFEYEVDLHWIIALGVALLALVIVPYVPRGGRTRAFVLTLAPFYLATAVFLASDRMPTNDSHHFFFPVFEYVGQSLSRDASFPAWFPIGGGVRSGLFQIPVFYFVPHRLLGYLLDASLPISSITAYKLQLILGVSLLALGWWLFLEKLTGSRLAASFGTIALAMGGTGITLHQEQVLSTTCLVPWFLLAACHVETDRRMLYALAIMFGLFGTLHYPHILVLSLFVFLAVYCVFRTRSAVAKIGSAIGLHIIPLACLFLVAAAPFFYFFLEMGELDSPLRVSMGAPMVADSYADYLALTEESMPGSSAMPESFLQYLFPTFRPTVPDTASFFVGRIAFVMTLVAIFLVHTKALPVLLMAVLFGLLTLGFRSPIPFIEVLFSLSPTVMGSFRQWFHFFPMLNFCLSALAALGLKAAIDHFETRAGRMGGPALLFLFAAQLFELGYYDLQYIDRFSSPDRPPEVRTAARSNPSRRGFSNPRTNYLQYRERIEVERCCVAAITEAPYLTTEARPVSGGVAEQIVALSLATGHDGGSVIVEAPLSLLEALGEAAAPPLEIGGLDLTYRFDGVDVIAIVNRPALLVLPLNYALGLDGEVNGEPVPVWRTNAVLSSVRLPAGESRVEIRVRPDAYAWIAIGQVLCVILLFALLAMSLRAQGRTGGTRRRDKARAPRPPA